MGSTDVLQEGLHLEDASGTVSLKVLLRTGGAINGIVKSANGSPSVGASVLLRPPSKSATRGGMIKTAITDSNGRFQFQGISPGDYRVIAFERLTGGDIQDPDLFAEHESAAVPVVLNDNSAESIAVTAVALRRPLP